MECCSSWLPPSHGTTGNTRMKPTSRQNDEALIAYRSSTVIPATNAFSNPFRASGAPLRMASATCERTSAKGVVIEGGHAGGVKGGADLQLTGTKFLDHLDRPFDDPLPTST